MHRASVVLLRWAPRPMPIKLRCSSGLPKSATIRSPSFSARSPGAFPAPLSNPRAALCRGLQNSWSGFASSLSVSKAAIAEALRTESAVDGADDVVKRPSPQATASPNPATVAQLTLWAFMTYPDCRGVVTANTETQLKTKTWAELGKVVQSLLVRT